MNSEFILFAARQYCANHGLSEHDIDIDPVSYTVTGTIRRFDADGIYMLINDEIDAPLCAQISIGSDSASLLTNPIHYRSLPEMQRMVMFSGKIIVETSNYGSQWQDYALHFARITQK